MLNEVALNRLVEPWYEIDLVIGSRSGSLGCIRECSHELFYFYVVRRNGVVRLHALPQRLAPSGHTSEHITSEVCAGFKSRAPRFEGLSFYNMEDELLRNARSLHR